MRIVDIFPFPKVLTVAVCAGSAIMDVYKTSYIVDFKSDKSPLTIADRNAHEIITSYLDENFTYPILSEEGEKVKYSIRKEWRKYWLIDPLDGTKEFVSQNGEFTVNISLIENGVPIIGIIYLPTINSLYFGSLNFGSYLVRNCDEQIAERDDLEVIKLDGVCEIDYPVVLGSRSHVSKSFIAYLNKLKSEEPNATFLPFGSSLKICKIAEGKANLYPRLGTTMEWDTAAGDAICRAVGIVIRDFYLNEPLKYNKPDLRNPHFILDNRKVSK